MKISSLVFSLLLSGSAVFAQYNVTPDNQHFFKLIAPSLTYYDSLDLSVDMGGSLTPVMSASIAWNAADSGKIDEMTMSYQGSATAKYVGHRTSGFYELWGLNPQQSPADTAKLTRIWSYSNGKDSLHQYYSKSNGAFVKDNSIFLRYSGNFVDTIYARTNPLNKADTTSYTVFHRSQGRLDSVVEYDMATHQPKVLILHEYSGSLLQGVKIFSKNSSGSTQLISEDDFKHDAQGKINQVDTYANDPNSGLFLSSRVFYYQRTIGLEEQSISTPTPKIELFPNPTGDVLSIEGNMDFTTYRIFDSGSKTLLEGSLEAGNEIDVSDLPSGAYFIKLSLRDNTAARVLQFQKY